MANANKLAALLRKCHQHVSENADNSLHIPSDIRQKYQHEDVDVNAEWETYLKFKFIYLLQLREKPDTTDEKIRKELQKSPRPRSLIRFIASWKEMALKEELTYKYRLSQLPADIVHSRWYWMRNSGIGRWCTILQGELKKLEDDSLSKSWQEVFTCCSQSVAGGPCNPFETEYASASVSRHAFQCLMQSIDQVQVHSSTGFLNVGTGNDTMGTEPQAALSFLENNFKAMQVQDIEPDCVTLGDNSLSDLAIRLVEALYEEEFDETGLIRQFLLEVKRRFNCDLCDYLDVSEDGEKICWRIATTGPEDFSKKYQQMPPDEAKQEVQYYESYSKGEGISGSILMLEESNIPWNTWNHIGSNDVYNDPRRSAKKLSAYETDMYPGVLKGGRIHNFWAFPVFRGSKLKGALRVVNRLTDDGNALLAGGWSYYDRLRIALITRWFSRFLEATQPQMQGKADWTEVFNRIKSIETMAQKLELQWVDRERLRGLLRHLTRDISKKQEGRRVGCCIMVVESGGNEYLLPRLVDYPLLQPTHREIRYPYDGLDLYHDVVDPLKGAYIFDHQGNFVRIAGLGQKDEHGHNISSGVEAIRSVTKEFEKSFCLLLTREGKNIQVFKKGDKLVEIFLSERMGSWRFRYPQDILTTMIKEAPDCAPGILKQICDTCMELSNQGQGTIIVVGHVSMELFRFEETGPQNYSASENLRDIAVPFFADIVKSEGATFVDNNGSISVVNSIVTSTRSWKKAQRLFPGRGGRHETGEMISRLAPEAMVVIVSASGSISIISNGGNHVASDL